MDFVLFLHIAAAIFLIGPLTVAAGAAPRFIRMGADGTAVLTWLARTVRVYGLASVLVFLLGVALVAMDKQFRFGTFWLSSSMTLFIVALGLLFGLVERDLRRALSRTAEGKDAPMQAGRVAGVTGAISLIWLAIVALMVFKPGQ